MEVQEKKKFRLIIAGSRSFPERESRWLGFAYRHLDALLVNQLPHVEIVCGCAKGADMMGEYYAAFRNLEVTLFPADWKAHGRKAGFRRNYEMAHYANLQGHGGLVCFWDGISKGTAHMMRIAEECCLPVKVIRFKPPAQMPKPKSKRSAHKGEKEGGLYV